VILDLRPNGSHKAKIIITSGEVLKVRCVGFLGRDLGPLRPCRSVARAPATRGSGKPDKHEQF